jgi:Ras-related GTP-binding protein A/B
MSNTTVDHQGPLDGRVRQWQDFNAFHDLVSYNHGALVRHLSQPLTLSSNNPASLTSRLGATIDVEQNHVRFLGDLILNLWDCGGQDAFMDSYLSIQRPTIFSHVGVMIYVFDVESREMAKDLEYYRECLDGLSQFSKEANVFLLVHKMDLVRDGERSAVFQRKVVELEKASGDFPVKVHGTSIYDETLYKAWKF